MPGKARMLRKIEEINDPARPRTLESEMYPLCCLVLYR